MILNLYDTEIDNPLASMIRDIDYDYQAEQWVIETHGMSNHIDPKRWTVKWELVDEIGVRARWERTDQDKSFPRLVFAADRFAGERAMLFDGSK